MNLGRRQWVIAEGYIPGESVRDDPALVSHETACILNAQDRDAHLRITIYFADRDPVGPYQAVVPARRTLHLRFNDLEDPQPVPRDTDYASIIESDVPIVVQHTRLDSGIRTSPFCPRSPSAQPEPLSRCSSPCRTTD